MATLRRRYAPPQRKALERARSAVAAQYGNLYGIKIKRWFVFNGHTAVIVGDTPKERKDNRRRFEERLASHRNTQGTSGIHRARRKANAA